MARTAAAAIDTATLRDRLRFSSTAHDGEIEAAAATARAELRRVGIDEAHPDALINYAVELYCKGAFNFDGNGDAYLSQFEHLRDSMKLSSDYLIPPAEGTGNA